MKTIYKYELRYHESCKLNLFEGAEILCTQLQRNSIYIWALVDTAKRNVERIFSVYPTGYELPENPGKYIGTVQEQNFSLVWHVFETTPRAIKVGDIVRSKDPSYVLASGSGYYTEAVVMRLEPMVLVSLDTTMRWESTVQPDKLELVREADMTTLFHCSKRL